MRSALEAAAVRVAPSMNAQGVANTVCAKRSSTTSSHLSSLSINLWLASLQHRLS